MEITWNNKTGFTVKTKQGKLSFHSDGRIEIEAIPEAIIISGPGEYEVKGFTVIGEKKGGYLVEAEEIKVGYQTDQETDVLITDSWEAAKNSQPSFVIPVDGAAGSALAKESSLEPRKEKKLVLNKIGLPEETELVILEPKA